jgi:hypothetical protein
MKNFFLVLLGGSVHGYTNPCGELIPFGLGDDKYSCENAYEAFVEGMTYLEANLPSFDVTNKCSLGFSGTGNVEDANPGVANVGANVSLQVKSSYKWAAEVPKDIFFEYVLPYANVNEGRSDWRELMLPVVQSVISASGQNPDEMTTEDVVYTVNDGLWNGAFGKNIVFKSSQTPKIYDPMSTLAFGYASCTGVSIFFIDALRSIGVAARIAGTPAWNGQASNGNHNWLEIWSPGVGWQFIEAAPAGGGETLTNPCDKWFCNPSNFANGTQVFAARFTQASEVRYPMAWDLSNTQIPGVDRTAYYQKVCNLC